MSEITAGFAMCGSFCTFSKVLPQMRVLLEKGMHIVPIMSQAAYSIDTRFGKAADFRVEIEEMCGEKIIHTLFDAEPIGPKKLLDVLVICPCTGNTLAKLANGITDSTVTLAAKAHLRNGRPLVLCPATNDALAASAKNIGALLDKKHVYFVPFRQDDPQGKPTSLVADFSLVADAAQAALEGRQLQPLLTVC